MRLARSYLDDWYKEKSGGQHLLSFASKYLEQATAKDPSAKLLTENNKGEPIALTIDDLAGEVLCSQSTYYTYEGAEKKALLKGRDLLRKAIEYVPYSIYYRSRLGDVFLNLHDKQSALAVAREAVQVNPKNLDARKAPRPHRSCPVTETNLASGTHAFLAAAYRGRIRCLGSA